MLNYFEAMDHNNVKTGRSIGFGTFNYLIAKVKEWAETEGQNQYIYLDENKTPIYAKDIVFGDINSN